MKQQRSKTEDQLAPIRAKSCPACGNPLDADDRFCPACGARQAVGSPEEKTTRFIRCNSCGAQLALEADSRSVRCPFCESTYVVDFSPEQTGRREPEFIIGFAIDQKEALRRFRNWIRSAGWFRPGDLARRIQPAQLRGVYLPFWSFTALAHSSWSAQIGEYWYRTETYVTTVNGKPVTRTRRVRETEWWPLSGFYHHYWSKYLIAAGKAVAQDAAEQIMPYRLDALRRYHPAYLAGWPCEEYVVDHDTAWARCEAQFRRQQQEAIARFLPGDTHRNLVVHTELKLLDADLILLPIYILDCKYRGKTLRFLINGQTGKVGGHLPISWRRVLIAVALAGVAVVVLALLLSWLL